MSENQADSQPPGLRRLVFHSLLSGLCPLIPIPFLDDWARDLLKKRLVAELVRRHGGGLADPELKLLACGHHPPTLEGCVRGCFSFALIKTVALVAAKVLRKVFRKILIFLTIKECVDGFSRTFHEAYLVRHALLLGRLPASETGVLEVRQAIEAAVAQVDPRPIEQLVRRAFAGSRKLLARGARQLGRLLQPLRRSGREDRELLHEDLPLDQEEELLGGLVDELTSELEHEARYLRQLEKLLENQLPACAAPPLRH
ncbi:MAG: hypothetical protein GY856_14180 [bacterium]|nr:hypothetical protein [bacterium]